MKETKEDVQEIRTILARVNRPITVRDLYARHLRHRGLDRPRIQAALDQLIARDEVHAIRKSRTTVYQLAGTTGEKMTGREALAFLDMFNELSRMAAEKGFRLFLSPETPFLVPSPTPEASRPSQGLSEGSGALGADGHITEDDTSIF